MKWDIKNPVFQLFLLLLLFGVSFAAVVVAIVINLNNVL